MNYKVYKVFRTDTLDVVYIGITRKELKVRFRGHFKEHEKNKRKFNYFSKYKPLLRIEAIVDGIPDLDRANELEVYYIKYFKDAGFNLLNATSGGDGTKNFNPWNKGLKCPYVDKLMSNSPNAKKIYMYDSSGLFVREFNSIKKANEFTGVSRQQIKYICELKAGYIMGKGFSFRYFKTDRISFNRLPWCERSKLMSQAKVNKMRKVLLVDKINNIEYRFNNMVECSEFLKPFGISKKSVSTYLGLSKETRKYKFNYET